MDVYTSIDNLRIGNRKFRSYKEMPGGMADWVEETTIKLLTGRNDDELTAVEELGRLGREFHVQPFFGIGGHYYFPDVFFPEFRLIVEIDGAYHRYSAKSDRERDALFRGIGIKTVRIPSSVVRSGDTIPFLRDAVENGRYTAAPKPRAKRAAKAGKSARRRKSSGKGRT